MHTKIIELGPPGMRVRLIHSEISHDHRGYFSEVSNILQWNNFQFMPCAQNVSISKAGVIRGLHMQVPAQAKLVRCLSGTIVDVAVDARKDSESFGRHVVALLDRPQASLFIPQGFLHGFLALEDSVVEYMVDNPYNAKRQITVNWRSPELEIDWGAWAPASLLRDPNISDKDRHAPNFSACDFSEISADLLDEPFDIV